MNKQENKQKIGTRIKELEIALTQFSKTKQGIHYFRL